MPNAPQLGQDYTYTEVRQFYMPDVTALHYVLIKNDRIVALRLREDYNPKIFNEPGEVWVGDKGAVKTRGNELASRTESVPVFVKKIDRRKYTFFGDHKVLDRAATAAELANARRKMQTVHEQGVSRIVYLSPKRPHASVHS